MKKLMYQSVILAFILIVSSCNSDNKLTKNNKPSTMESTQNKEQEEIKAVVDKLLFEVGNYNLEALDAMVSDKAMIGISSLKDGVWTNTELTINEYFESIKKRQLTPYCEIPSSYEINLTQGRLAYVKADAILHRFGIPQTREINNFILIKENDTWKFLNISFTIEQLAEEKRKFDLNIFARSYAQAWGSKRPEFVASYFTKDGVLKVNDGIPAKGKASVSKVAEGFMTAFPDMVVLFDSLVTKPNGTEFHWTLLGTNTGPGGTGKKVKVSGFELWQIKDGKIKDSQGQFSEKEYNRQLEFGMDK